LPGDEAFLHQIFLVFLDNAIKYSPSHAVIHVILQQGASAIRACFPDQGIGIAPPNICHSCSSAFTVRRLFPVKRTVAGLVWQSRRLSRKHKAGRLNVQVSRESARSLQ
jgi:K+-sensing histidine kinase KdpD